MAAGEPATQPVGRDRGDHRGEHRREPYPRLRVVPRDDRLEGCEVPGAGRIVGEGALDDLGERPPRRRDGDRLVDVERAPTDGDQADHEHKRRAEQGKHAVGGGQQSIHEVVRSARLVGGVCRNAHCAPR